MARVVPTWETARRSMLEVELGKGALEVVRRIESRVAGWARRMVRRLVMVVVLGREILFIRCVRESGTLVRVCSMLAAMRRLREKR